jgi:hypothetical protein
MSIVRSTEQKILLLVHFQDADTSGVRAVIRPSQTPKKFIAASMAISTGLCDGRDGGIAPVKPFVSNHLRFLMFVLGCTTPVQKESGCNHMTVS